MRFVRFDFGIFLRSRSFLTHKLRKISHALLGTNPQSLPEEPSYKIRFSRDVVRVFAHGVQCDEK